MGKGQDYNPTPKYPSVTQTRTLCYKKIIQAENPNSATSLNMLNFKSILVGRGCHTSSEILDWLVGSQAGWLAGLLLSGIECLKQSICKSCRFCTSGRNLVLKVIQGWYGALAGWLAGWLRLAGRLWLVNVNANFILVHISLNICKKTELRPGRHSEITLLHRALHTSSHTLPITWPRTLS